MRIFRTTISILFVISFILFITGCDDVTGERTYGGRNSQSGYAVHATDDGGCIIAGNNADNFYVLKLDATGNVEWSKTPGGSARDWAYAVKETSDGGFLVAGDTESKGPGDPENYGSYGNVWVIKYDASGNRLWEKVYGHELYEGLRSMELTSDGGFILTGYTHSFGNGDVYVVKCNSQGAVQWEKNFGDNNTQVGQAVKKSSDGGYIVAATTMDDTGKLKSMLIKLDSAGNKIWTKVFGSDGLFNTIQSIDVSGNTIIAAGYQSTDIIPNNDSNAWVLKLDASGVVIWEKSYGGSYKDIFSAVRISGNGFILTGETRSYGKGNQYESDVWVVRIDSAGVIQWYKTYGGGDNDTGRALDLLDNGYLIVGDTMKDALNFYDVYVLKLDQSGNL